MFVLTDIERLAVLSGCITLLVLVMIITACLVCPACWLYKLLTRRLSKSEDETGLKYLKSNFPLTFLDKGPPPPYDSTTKTSIFDSKSPLDFSKRLTSVNSISSSVCSDSDSVAGIPLPVFSDAEIPAVEIPENSSSEPGYVTITLQYKQITGEDKKVFAQLRVDLKEAGELPLRAYGGRCSPYFSIGLYDMKSMSKKKRRKSGPVPLHYFYTTVVRKSQHPVYNESFFFPLEQNEVKKCTLKFEAWDQDKLANDTTLGEVNFNLKDIASFLLEQPSKELDFFLKLEESKTNYGQLLVGLCYLPTSERVTVAVLKVNNLKKCEKCSCSDFYVQAMAIYGGKVFEKRKTSSRPSSPSPVFNEMLMFDVPFKKLDHITLLLALRSTHLEIPNTGNETCQKSSIKDECIGKAVIGSCGKKNALSHWIAMRNAPRRQVIQWHILR